MESAEEIDEDIIGYVQCRVAHVSSHPHQVVVMTAQVLNPRNAALGIAFDVVFGAIPAVICALFAIYGAVALVSITSLSSELVVMLVWLLLVLLSVTGFGSSLALLYAIFTRGRVKHNATVRGLLVAGMMVTLVAFAMVLYIFSTILEQTALTMLLLMIALCALKYLRVLSNSEVHP